MSAKFKTLLMALRQHYSQPLPLAFKQFRNGLIYFATGFGTMMMAMVYMPPSVKQEWIVLGGLILGALGFVLAMTAQMRLLLSRLLQFYWGSHESPEKPTQKNEGHL